MTFGKLVGLWVLAAVLCGCARQQASPDVTIRKLLRTYASSHCGVESVIERYSQDSSDDLAKAGAWLATALAKDPRVHLLWRSQGEVWSRGELEYDEDGKPYHVWWSDFHPPGIPINRRLTLRACLFAPSRIDVVDADYGPRHRQGRVLFMTVFQPSWLGEQLRAQGLLDNNNTFPEPSSFETVADVKKDRAGVWSVESYAPNS